MNKTENPIKKRDRLKRQVRKLSLQLQDTEKTIKEREEKLKKEIGIPICEIEEILNKYKKLHINLTLDFKLLQSYGGPSPDNGKSEVEYISKSNILKDVIFTFEMIIKRTMNKHLKFNK